MAGEITLTEVWASIGLFAILLTFAIAGFIFICKAPIRSKRLPFVMRAIALVERLVMGAIVFLCGAQLVVYISQLVFLYTYAP